MEKLDRYLVKDTSEAEKYSNMGYYSCYIPFNSDVSFYLKVKTTDPKEWKLSIEDPHHTIEYRHLAVKPVLPPMFTYGLRTGAFSFNATAAQEFLAKKAYLETFAGKGMENFSRKIPKDDKFTIEDWLCKMCICASEQFAADFMQYALEDLSDEERQDEAVYIEKLKEIVEWMDSDIPWQVYFDEEYDEYKNKVNIVNRIHRNTYVGLCILEVPFRILKDEFPEVFQYGASCEYSKFNELFDKENKKSWKYLRKNVTAAQKYPEFLKFTSIRKFRYSDIKKAYETNGNVFNSSQNNRIADKSMSKTHGKTYRNYLRLIEKTLQPMYRQLNIAHSDRKHLVKLAQFYGATFPIADEDTPSHYEHSFNYAVISKNNRVSALQLVISKDCETEELLEIVAKFSSLTHLRLLFRWFDDQPKYFDKKRELMIIYEPPLYIDQLYPLLHSVWDMKSLRSLEVMISDGDEIIADTAEKIQELRRILKNKFEKSH